MGHKILKLKHERHQLYKTIALDMRKLQKDMDRFIEIEFELEKAEGERWEKS